MEKSRRIHETNCKAGSYLHKCGFEVCWKVPGERCDFENKFVPAKCHPKTICTPNQICIGDLDEWSSRDASLAISNMRSSKRNFKTVGNYPNFIDQYSYENNFDPEEVLFL
jgi:hypothetical protein